jgi:hypothetical protein
MNLKKEANGYKIIFGENESHIWHKDLKDESNTDNVIYDVLDRDDKTIGLFIPFGKVKVGFSFAVLLQAVNYSELLHSIELNFELDGEYIIDWDIKQ